MLIATAGHVDHGKTALVRALTGVDTDRLPEEKARGLTIDLGFAYRRLTPDGPVVGFVDVPGHERFVRNMLAGVAAIDEALLIVAADDGPMPQTREHLAILDLLDIGSGTVVVTKIDRVPAERAAEVAATAVCLLNGTRLAGAPTFGVSAQRGDGVEDLRAHLDRRARACAARPCAGHFRLAVDRVFTVGGTGLVVTGTAFSGRVTVGDQVIVSPAGMPARVRGLRAFDSPAKTGEAGQRCALNLAGPALRKELVRRGDWVVAPPAHLPMRRFDARIRLLAGEPRSLAHWTPVHVHLGSADVTGRVALLGREALAPGETALAQLVLDAPLLGVRGDRFILRDQSARRTLGGGEVLDLYPPPRGRARPERLRQVEAMAAPSAAAALRKLLQATSRGVRLDRFRETWNLTEAEAACVEAGVDMTVVETPDGRLGLPATALDELAEAAVATLATWHQRHTDHVGPHPEQLRRLIPGTTPPLAVLAHVAERLCGEGRLVRDGVALRLPEHRARLTRVDAKLWRRVAPLLDEGGLRPPIFREIAAALAIDHEELRRLMARAARVGLVLPVTPNRYFPPAAVRVLADIAEQLAAGSPDRRFDAAAYRDAAGIGRNLTIEVLEYFDRAGLTRRDGQARVVVRPAAAVVGTVPSPHDPGLDSAGDAEE